MSKNNYDFHDKPFFEWTDEEKEEEARYIFDDNRHWSEELICSDLHSIMSMFSSKIKRLKMQNEDKILIDYYSNILRMCKSAESRISGIPFPDIYNDEDWNYEIEINTSGICLYLIHYDWFDMTDEDCFFFDNDFKFKSELIEARYLTVNEYAKLYNVKDVTVRQWIRRGKLRNAIKEGNEWKISELSIPANDRGYKTADYNIMYEIENLPDEYSFLKKCESVRITQNQKNKKLFNVELWKHDHSDYVEMDTQTREKFEYYLISHPLVKSRDFTISPYDNF